MPDGALDSERSGRPRPRPYPPHALHAMPDPLRPPQPNPAPASPGDTSSVVASREAASFAQLRLGGTLREEGSGLYRLLVESVRDYAIFVLDPNGIISSWNAGAQRLKGYTADEIIGKHFSIFYPPERIAERFPQYELSEASRVGRFEDEGWRVRKDGSYFWANVVITALRDEDGTLVGFAKVTRDLTERRAAEQRAIEDARRIALADAANRAKAGFLAAMSHELRTPLNAIGGYADLLILGLGGSVSEQQRSYLDRIRSSQQHLLGIINDILNFSKIEAGQIAYEVRPVDLQSVIEAVVPMVEPQLRAKELSLASRPVHGVVALADRAKTEQVLLNLLSNAVKFTEPGGRIEVAARRAAGVVSIEVADTGIGVPAEYIDTIFEPFTQVGRSLTQQREGTGLGLAISRDMARAMSGDLTVESTPGKGSRFVLTLPAAPGDTHDRGA